MDDTSRQSREEARAVLYDCDIREPLFDYLEERFGKTRMFEEKIIGRSRADILMLTEQKFIGLEINRLPGYKEKSKRFVQQKLLEKMEWDILKSQMCEELFERDYTLWMEEETKRQRSLPRSKMIASKHKHIHIERESSKQVMP